MIRILFLLLLLTPAFAHAQGCAPAPAGLSLPPCCATSDMSAGGSCMAAAAQYQFTLLNFGFEKADGTIVEIGRAQSFDAASVNANAEIGNFISGAKLPDASYVAVRPTLGREFTVMAKTETRDGRACAGSASGPLQAHGDLPACNLGAPHAGTPLCTDGGQLRLRSGEAGTFMIGGGNAVTLNISFDVNNGAVCNFTPGTGPARSIGVGALAVRVRKLMN